ncbi:hypothetical protein [Sphingomonas sp.]|uniref:hypothetical protein n=1 Tax=Sphingomonas sp. TaxID=28214 RepID=UPI003CC6C55C
MSATGAVDVALDAHYYDGGLRVRRLGADAAGWTPAPPERFAGFRDEVPLAGDDLAVEIARLLIDGHPLWWIAIYARAADKKFGDRGNEAGVGVWVRDGDIGEPRMLLDGLRQLTAKLIGDGVDQADAVARSFLGSDYLPRYVGIPAPMPPQLSGWRRAAGPGPTTALYVIDARVDGAEWDLIAEQIGRMTLLPGPTPDHSRAVILVRAGGSAAAPSSTVRPLPSGFATEVLALLPAALAEVARDDATLRAKVGEGAATAKALEASLAQAQAAAAEQDAAIADLRREVAALQEERRSLQQQIDGDDTLARLQSIDKGLKQIETLVRRSEPARREPSSLRDDAAEDDRRSYRTVAAPEAYRSAGRSRSGSEPYQRFLMPVGAVAGIVVTALLLFAVYRWWHPGSSSVPAAVQTAPSESRAIDVQTPNADDSATFGRRDLDDLTGNRVVEYRDAPSSIGQRDDASARGNGGDRPSQGDRYPPSDRP